jgi:beta-barrel assembly-enhancing protease
VIRRGAALGCLLLAVGCVETSYNLATQRQEYTITSVHKEVDIGRKVARRVEAELPQLHDPDTVERVQRIGDRLAAVCDRQELIYHFGIIDEETVNAFSLPGGYVYIFQGLIERTASDDELAGVMAHEIAHITARHAIKRYETGLGAQLVQLATIAGQDTNATRGLGVAMGAARLAYARQDELEADRLAVKYLEAAGFDGAAMLAFLDTLHGLNQDHTRYLPAGVTRPQYALTHPYVPERLREVKEALFGVADYIDYLNTSE